MSKIKAKKILNRINKIFQTNPLISKILILSFFISSLLFALSAEAASNSKTLSAQEEQAKILMSQGMNLEAIEVLKQMLLIRPSNLDWQIYLANLYRKTDNLEEALRLYDQILQKKPDHQDALMGKAYIARSQKNWVQAKEEVNRVLALNPQNVDALVFKADLERRDVRYEESRRLYQEALNVQPGNEDALEGLKLVDEREQRVGRLEQAALGPLVSPQQAWQVEVGGGAQDFNYNSTAPSIYTQVLYKRPQKYYLLGRFDYLDKFGSQASQFTAGGGYYVHPKIILNDTVSISTNDIVTPRVQNIFEIDGILPKGFMPYLRYTFRHYDGVDLNMITPGFQWYYSNWFILDLNYTLAINDFQGLPSGRTDNSFSGRVYFIPIENRLSFFAYYARTEESFDTGNALQFGRFHANLVGGGVEGFFTNSMGLRFYTDYENRDNGQTVHSYNSAFLYRF